MPISPHRASQVQVIFLFVRILRHNYMVWLVGIVGIVWYVYKASLKDSALYSTYSTVQYAKYPSLSPPSPRLPCLPRFLSASMLCYHHIIVYYRVAIPHATSPPLLYLPRRASLPQLSYHQHVSTLKAEKKRGIKEHEKKKK